MYMFIKLYKIFPEKEIHCVWVSFMLVTVLV